jgi:tRNA(fMet)-specific endonuclease VapC
MGILIDTNILIRCERNQIDVDQLVAGRGDEEFLISVITGSELLHGVWRAEKRSVQIRRQAFVEAILSHFVTIPIDLSVARTHSKIWADLQSNGKMIGIHDSWIAATCIAKGLSLITGNSGEFNRVEGLVVESW